MTDKDVIKALEWCGKADCVRCPYIYLNCRFEMVRKALDLINRQQSAIDVYMQENDRLKTAYIQVSMDRDEAKAEIERLQIRLRKERHQFEDLGRMYSEIRAEAIKECLDRIDAFLCGVCGSVVEDNPNLDRILFGYNTEEVDAFIDNLRKEMVGENK